MLRPLAFVILIVFYAAQPTMAGEQAYKSKDCGAYTAQMDLNSCAGDNYQAADDALNALYKQVMAKQPDDASRAGLKKSERSWIAYRDKSCKDEVGDQADSGSIWPMEMSLCLQKQTDARIATLRRMLTCTAGASACNLH